MCVSQVFLNTCMRGCGGNGSEDFSSLFIVSDCCWRGRLCFDRGRDRGFVWYISLFLRVLGCWVCVCLYTRVHTHKLLGHSVSLSPCRARALSLSLSLSLSRSLCPAHTLIFYLLPACSLFLSPSHICEHTLENGKCTHTKTAGKWQKCNLVSGMTSVASNMGWL